MLGVILICWNMLAQEAELFIHAMTSPTVASASQKGRKSSCTQLDLCRAISIAEVIAAHAAYVEKVLVDALSAEVDVAFLQELNHEVAQKVLLTVVCKCVQKCCLQKGWATALSEANEDSGKCNAMTMVVSRQPIDEEQQVAVEVGKKKRYFAAARCGSTWFVSCHVPIVSDKKSPPNFQEDTAAQVLEQLSAELRGERIVAGGDWNAKVHEVAKQYKAKDKMPGCWRNGQRPDEICPALSKTHAVSGQPLCGSGASGAQDTAAYEIMEGRGRLSIGISLALKEGWKASDTVINCDQDLAIARLRHRWGKDSARPPTANLCDSLEVYFGKLKDGTEVAVKCLRPGVKRLLEADLALLLCFGNWAESLEPLRMLGLKKAAEEFCEHVQMQTDFRTEASHLHRFRENFEELKSIRFPSPLYASQELLVLSREVGRELSRVFREAMTSDGHEERQDVDRFESHADTIRSILGIPQDVSRRIASDSLAAYMRMIFKDQFIHGDLHPGNVMLKLAGGSSSSHPGQDKADDGASLVGKASDRLNSVVTRARGQPFELIILDAGLAIPLAREKVEALRSLALAIIYGDFNRAAQILYDQSPDTSNCQDPQAFKSGLAKAFCDCRKQVYEDGFVQVSDAVLEALRLVRYYNVGLDTTLTWTLLGMLSIEGSARQLDPEVDCARAATRYILNLPSLRKELQSQSWHTSRHMFTEMLMNRLGFDYWAHGSVSSTRQHRNISALQ
ncbi:ADCK2 [Symbiodinium sp. CCMP2456]|nr:ADCK2 [Symbiodinium sp. CCMP2456]